MKGFRKLSSIAVLLFAFVSPPSLVEAKDINLSNTLNEQSVAPDANLIGNKTGEVLIAQRRSRRYYRRREMIQRRYPFGRRQIIRRQQLRQRQIIRGRQRFGEEGIIQRRQRFGRDQIIRRRY
ncbi:hypothetical protein [Nostoc sp. NMS4]|uniref:hypothetical protein n=1 Tax=Nostoc sp. NMS4 TaxID=2815390 RepID=UPI0025E76B0F|nr:hypothetical protein [Nostoc sp. NMS4]MBN3921778.1 hypothetical protein [Nostoc sp. NMS4]